MYIKSHPLVSTLMRFINILQICSILKHIHEHVIFYILKIKYYRKVILFHIRNTGQDIFLFDPPHLLKSLRNNVEQKNWVTEAELLIGIKKVYEFSLESPLNLIPKISDRHFQLGNFSKMSVSLAAQVFSESMYTAYLVYKLIFPEKFENENDMTFEFVRDIDKLFDSLNSILKKSTLSNKLNYAISSTSEHKKFLNEILNNFEMIKFESQKPD